MFKVSACVHVLVLIMQFSRMNLSYFQEERPFGFDVFAECLEVDWDPIQLRKACSFQWKKFALGFCRPSEREQAQCD